MRRLNIGCGPYKLEGAINIDRNPRQNPDIVRDVTKGLPFDDDSVDYIQASHFLEHLTREDMMFVIEECYRVLTAGADFYIRVPLLDFTSLDHLQIFDAKSFDPLEFPETPDYYQRKFRWKIARKEIHKDARSGLDNLDIVLRAVKPF
jgi:predicted SAM-dependent methyltransferase